MKRNVRRRLEKRKHRISERLKKARERKDTGQPTLTRRKPKFDVAGRTVAMSDAGIAVVHQVVLKSGLVERIDGSLHLLKRHRPYHESDHVLNIAYNAFCGGQCLDDIELRRNDEGFLEALGIAAIPDPTTAGDFCRRFDEDAVHTLMDAINETRVELWKSQPDPFFDCATIDIDSTIVESTGEAKEGIGLSYKGIWGFHPLMVSLANTGEVLYIANRSGNMASQSGAAEYISKAIKLCFDAGFRDVLVRGDSAFSLTKHFGEWTAMGAHFVFGYKVAKGLKDRADAVDEEAYGRLVRAADELADTAWRAKQPRFKEAFIIKKGYRNIRLNFEDVAEFEYQPCRAKEPYRMVALRKNLTVKKGDQALFDDIRYFLYVTNDPKMTPTQVVRHANLRCDQEKLIDQLKNGVRAFRAPLNRLDANWAYMVMTALAWNIKAWMALMLPISAESIAKHSRERLNWLRMSFRSFVNNIIKMPAQVVSMGGQRIIRLLSWKSAQPAMIRLLSSL